MSASVRGWCPSLLQPMQTADGWLVRLKPACGLLPAPSARRLAEAAKTLGNGKLELTQRAGLQIRGLTEATLEPFARLALALGLAAADPGLEARRNIIASPLTGFDESMRGDLQAIVSLLETTIRYRPALARLPDKFGFLLDGGGLLPLADVSADLALRCADRRIELADAWAVTPAAGWPLGEAVLALAEAFVTLSAGRFRRMRGLLDQQGVEPLLQTAGLDAAASAIEPSESGQPHPGFHSNQQGRLGAALVFWPFGALSASALEHTAALAERWGDGHLRITPWRALAIAGVRPGAWPSLEADLAALGAVTAAGDPLLRVSACPGRGACANSPFDTRNLARALAENLDARVERLHVSGCSKGCAHPRPAALTLVGEREGWGLIRNGRSDALPVKRGLTKDEVLDLLRHA